jgi:SAM-dependent methyltransferase
MSLSRCTHCGHVFADPMPTAEGLKLLYGHEYFDRSWSKFAELVTRLIKDGVSPLPTYPIYTRLQDWLARIDPVWWGGGGLGRQALDLGCADGAFMVGLRNRGWKVMGQDVTDRFASYYETIGIPFQGGPSTDISIEESSIDLCTMTHVIEHLSDPAEVLRGIHSWLKPGGRLLLMTPCCGTLTAWLGGKQWFYMTEHVHFFSPQSLMSLGRRLGFQPLYWRTRVGIQHETPFRAWRRQLMGGPIEKLFEALGHGDVIELVLSKEGSSTSSGNSIPAGGS